VSCILVVRNSVFSEPESRNQENISAGKYVHALETDQKMAIKDG